MNLFIFHIHSITPRQSILYPDIMTKTDIRDYYDFNQPCNLHTQVIMAWFSKNFIFQKKKFRQKDAEVLGNNTIPALMSFRMYVRSIVGILNTVSPTYSSILTYNPQVHMPCWVTLNVSCHAVLYNTKKLTRRDIR